MTRMSRKESRIETSEIPRHQKKAPKKKPYGIEYFSNWFGCWECHNWYATKKARDDAFKNLITKTDGLTGMRATKMPRKVDRK